MAKNDNMLAILWMLNSGTKITAKQISDRLEINIRTVYRYIDALCASGVPIISDSGHNGGYRLLNNFIKSPLIFDLEEKKALLHAAVFAKEAGYPLNEVLDRATSKLKLYSNQEQEHNLNHHLASLEVINHAGNPDVQIVLSALDQAITERYSVEIDYRTGRDEHTKNRVIEPYGLVYWNNKWFTVAFCQLRNEIRSFRVDRILGIKHKDRTFALPEHFSAREFFLQNLLPEHGEKTTLVTLILSGRAEALDDLCRHWYLGYHLKERTVNKATFILEEKALYAYVPYFLLSYGKAVQVIEPQDLKTQILSVLSDLTEHYQL